MKKSHCSLLLFGIAAPLLQACKERTGDAAEYVVAEEAPIADEISDEYATEADAVDEYPVDAATDAGASEEYAIDCPGDPRCPPE